MSTKPKKETVKGTEKIYCKYCRNVINRNEINANNDCPKCTKENSTFLIVTEKNRNKVRF